MNATKTGSFAKAGLFRTPDALSRALPRLITTVAF